MNLRVRNYGYNYSSALFVKFKKPKEQLHHLNMLVGLAPVFSGIPNMKRQGAHLDSLIYTLSEVENIHRLIDGIIYKDTNATVVNFLKTSQQYKIGHLATHASCDDLNPENSRIHFADTSLSCNEIYNLTDLNYEMMVLSACETGSGKLQKGEGIISLARAFMSAGCPSVITSLWQVNDKRTADLMKLFYENIDKQQQKHIALNNAQRTYLKNEVTAFTHPYYWGAFIAIGNVDAISGGGFAWYWWGIGGIGLLLLVFLIRRYRLFHYKK